MLSQFMLRGVLEEIFVCAWLGGQCWYFSEKINFTEYKPDTKVQQSTICTICTRLAQMRLKVTFGLENEVNTCLGMQYTVACNILYSVWPYTQKKLCRMQFLRGAVLYEIPHGMPTEKVWPHTAPQAFYKGFGCTTLHLPLAALLLTPHKGLHERRA